MVLPNFSEQTNSIAEKPEIEVPTPRGPIIGLLYKLGLAKTDAAANIILFSVIVASAVIIIFIFALS